MLGANTGEARIATSTRALSHQSRPQIGSDVKRLRMAKAPTRIALMMVLVTRRQDCVVPARFEAWVSEIRNG